MKYDVEEWCKNCETCAMRKPPTRKCRAEMKIYQVGAPMERLATDILGPLPLSDNGNRYILVVADYFTKRTEAFPIPKQEAHTIANVIVKEVITRFGVCHEIHSDQGRNYESKVFHEVCNLLGIRKTRTTPMRPQSDGMVERFNRTIEVMLSAFVSKHQKDWDVYLPFLTMAYRSSQHESTGYSPNRLMLGREISLPVDLLFGPPPRDGFSDESHYARHLRSCIGTSHKHAILNLKSKHLRQKKNYDRFSSGTPYNVGDKVWLLNPKKRKGRSLKLSNFWEGPFAVTQCISNVVFRIQKGSKSKSKVVHYDRLKPYVSLVRKN